MAKQESGSNVDAKDYEHIGRQMESIVATGYASKARLLGINFVKGVASGAGSVVGAALMIVILGWVLSRLDSIPFIGDISQGIQETIESSKVTD